MPSQATEPPPTTACSAFNFVRHTAISEHLISLMTPSHTIERIDADNFEISQEQRVAHLMKNTHTHKGNEVGAN